MDSEKQRQHRHDDARLTESRNARSEQLTRDAYRVANQYRMASRRALEWIRTLKAQLVFRYEISDLFHFHNTHCICVGGVACLLLLHPRMSDTRNTTYPVDLRLSQPLTDGTGMLAPAAQLLQIWVQVCHIIALIDFGCFNWITKHLYTVGAHWE